ncbi:hypothetical protein KR009_004974 [Drosophila setifemur]|nr:hypothetical protein KR009_004974 [Drosophila setifemur]
MALSNTLMDTCFGDQLNTWRYLGVMELCAGNFFSWAMALNIFVYHLTPMLLISIFSYDTPLENITNFSLSITSLATLTKHVIYIRQLSLLEDVKELMTQLDDRVKGEEQIRRREQMVKHMIMLSRVYLVIFGIVILNSEVTFLFKSGRNLPFPAWFPLDWKNSTGTYLFAVTCQEIAIFHQIMQNYANDTFPPLAIFFVSEQCQLLVLRISSIGYGPVTPEENHRELVNCIRDQNRLYRLLEVILRIISWSMLVQFIVIAVNIGVTMFGLVFYVKTVPEFMYYVPFLFALTLETSPLCYYGSVLEESFKDLHYAVFRSNWVDQGKSYRSTVLIMSERTKRKHALLAGHLVPIHLSTFAASLKAAYSYFTLMANQNERNDAQE